MHLSAVLDLFAEIVKDTQADLAFNSDSIIDINALIDNYSSPRQQDPGPGNPLAKPH